MPQSLKSTFGRDGGEFFSPVLAWDTEEHSARGEGVIARPDFQVASRAEQGCPALSSSPLDDSIRPRRGRNVVLACTPSRKVKLGMRSLELALLKQRRVKGRAPFPPLLYAVPCGGVVLHHRD